MALTLLHLPHEVLHGVLSNVNPQDLVGLCCCRALNDFIKSNLLLHKELYLRNFDEPPLDPGDPDISWSSRLKELVHFQKILESDNTLLKSSQLEAITKSVEYLLQTSASSNESSLNIDLLTRLFESQQNTNTLLCGSRLFDWARAESWGSLVRERLNRERNKPSEARGMGLEALESAINWEGITEEVTLAASLKPEPENFVILRRESLRQRPEEGNASDQSSVSLGGRCHRSLQQLSAKLHCLYGVSIDIVRKDTTAFHRYSLRSDTVPVHSYARSLVYDLRQHTDHSLWGPFIDDGSQKVDWEKIEAIMIVLDHNIKTSPENQHLFEGMVEAQKKPFVGASPKSFVSPPSSIPMEPAHPLELQDPYNITGTWMRVVCFLDYTELYDFNFDGEPIEHNQPRPPIDTDEAIRLIRMKLRVTKIEAPGEEDGQGLPVVHFNGKSSSLRPSFDPNANSKTKGTVRLTPHGEVRWTTFTVFHGSSEERWRSESIQIGGVQSARGVLGFWFDKDYDEHGPAGPTSFWKIHDGIEEQKRPRTHSPMTRFTVPMY